jgi:hypothetical protein
MIANSVMHFISQYRYWKATDDKHQTCQKFHLCLCTAYFYLEVKTENDSIGIYF